MESNGASSGGVGPGSAGGTAIASSPGGPNQFAWGAPPLGANDQLRTSNSGNNPQAGAPMDIQQILQQQQVTFCYTIKKEFKIVYQHLNLEQSSKI